MSSFMPLDSACNFLKVSEPSNDAKQLVNLAEQVGADGVAVDYEPVAVNQVYNENYKLYTPSSSLKALDYNTFAKLYFDNQNKNTSPYFEALRNDVIGSQKLNQGKGLFAIVAGKSGFYNEIYDGKSWSTQSTFMIDDILKQQCDGRCFASVMFYDTYYQGQSDNLYSMIGSMTTGFNVDSAGLPAILNGVPFRVMLPLSYSQDTYYNDKTDSPDYTYSGFLCDMGQVIAQQWLATTSVNACAKTPTYLANGGQQRKKVDPVASSKNKPEIGGNLKTQFATFFGVDLYRVVTQGFDKSNQYLCDRSSSSGLFACKSTSAVDPNVQDVVQYFPGRKQLLPT